MGTRLGTEVALSNFDGRDFVVPAFRVVDVARSNRACAQPPGDSARRVVGEMERVDSAVFLDTSPRVLGILLRIVAEDQLKKAPRLIARLRRHFSDGESVEASPR